MQSTCTCVSASQIREALSQKRHHAARLHGKRAISVACDFPHQQAKETNPNKPFYPSSRLSRSLLMGLPRHRAPLRHDRLLSV